MQSPGETLLLGVGVARHTRPTLLAMMTHMMRGERGVTLRRNTRARLTAAQNVMQVTIVAKVQFELAPSPATG